MKLSNKFGWMKNIYILSSVLTIAALIVIYTKTNSPFAIGIVVVFGIHAFSICILIPIMLIRNAKFYPRKELKKRFSKFIGFFVTTTVGTLILTKLFVPQALSITRIAVNGFGLAFGLSFTDVILFRSKPS